MKNKHILIVEDEPAIRQLIILGMSEKYSFSEAGTLAEAEAYLKTRQPNLILLDWMLPDGSGVGLLKSADREGRFANIPVIMLTARASEADITQGLDLGADDYLTKPFSLSELQSRINAILRRIPETYDTTSLTWQDIHIDLTSHRVFYREQAVALHRREFNLLRHLLAQRGKVHSREQLLDNAWGEETDIGDRAVDVSIRRLRKAFEEAGYNLPLSTIRGIGYRLG